MSETKWIRSSRLIWTLAFLIEMILILAVSYIITRDLLPLVIMGSVLLLFLAFSLAMLFREAIVPSWIEKDGSSLTIRWNNWKLDGTLVSAELPKKRRLALTLKEAKLTLTPIGPLMGLAGLILKPLLGLFLPDYLAQSYYFKKESLLKKIRSGENHYKLVFPTFLLGKRKVKKWLG